MKKEKLLLALVLVCFVLLLASLGANIVLINKLHNVEKQEISNNKNNNSLIGIYYNDNKGNIEIVDNKTAILLNDNKCTYEVKGNNIIFTYYINLEPLNDKCYAKDNTGKYVETNCKHKQTINGKIVSNGIIYNNTLFSKMS